MRATTGRRLALGFAVLGLLAAGAVRAEEPAAPEGKPVKWDQARVTQYAVDLNAAIGDAVQAMRKNQAQQISPAQRNTWYDLKEDLRLIDNSAGHLQSELQAGSGADETRATFDRIESLRHDAEEHGRRSEIPGPVLDALVRAGSIHNLMMPYYHGKR